MNQQGLEQVKVEVLDQQDLEQLKIMQQDVMFMMLSKHQGSKECNVLAALVESFSDVIIAFQGGVYQ